MQQHIGTAYTKLPRMVVRQGRCTEPEPLDIDLDEARTEAVTPPKGMKGWKRRFKKWGGKLGRRRKSDEF
jgi:hypothetical protein